MRGKQDKKRTVNNHYDGHAPPKMVSKNVQKYAEAEDVSSESDAETNSVKAVSVKKTVTTVLSNKTGENAAYTLTRTDTDTEYRWLSVHFCFPVCTICSIL